MKKSKISPSIDCTLGEFEILMIKSKISRSIDCTLGEFEILMNKSKISLSIGCTLGEFEICRTSYPTWLSAKQYTIGESFFHFDECLFLQEKCLRILLRQFPLSTGHPPLHERLHMQVIGISSNTNLP